MLAKDLILLNKKPTNKSFEFTINTNNTSTGSSTNLQFLLPLVTTGIYNFSINWGDGTTNLITAYNQAEITHTYSAVGMYIIRITGKCKGFRFNGTGDRLKLLEIKNWGCFELADGNVDNQFSGCTNLIVTANDNLNLSGTEINLNYIFNNCSNVAFKRFSLKTNSIQFMRYFFRNAVKFNKSINFNCLGTTSLEGFLYGATLFNSNIVLSNTNSCTNMSSMFYNCTNFNQDVSNLLVNSVLTMADMFTGCTNFSKENYSNFLVSCASQSVQSTVTLNCPAQYNLDGQSARNYLTGTKSWNIVDGGFES